MHSAPSGLFAQGCLADLLDRLHSPLVLAALPTSKTSFKASENVGQKLGLAVANSAQALLGLQAVGLSPT